MRWPGAYALEEAGGAGEGDVAGFRWTSGSYREVGRWWMWWLCSGGPSALERKGDTGGEVLGPPRSYREVKGWWRWW